MSQETEQAACFAQAVQRVAAQSGGTNREREVIKLNSTNWLIFGLSALAILVAGGVFLAVDSGRNLQANSGDASSLSALLFGSPADSGACDASCVEGADCAGECAGECTCSAGSGTCSGTGAGQDAGQGSCH